MWHANIGYPRPSSLPDSKALLRPVARSFLRGARAAPVWAQLLQQRVAGQGPRIAFLPSRDTGGGEGGKASGSSHLRIGCIAAALGARGWSTLVLPWRLTLAQRHALLAGFAPDVIVMQGVRHDLNRPDLYPGHRILLDIDDADFHLAHLEAPMAAAMDGVAGVIAGSRYVADWARGQGAEAHVVWTGTPASDTRLIGHGDRPPIVAWAQSRPGDYVEEAALVRRVMGRVAAYHPGVRLRLYDRRAGDDDGLLQSFEDAGIQTEQVSNMRYSDYLASFDQVAIGLAPLCASTPFSRGKSFGKVLAYLDRGVPVVASDMADHADFFTSRTGVITNDEGVWIDRILELLDDPVARDHMADAAHDAFAARLTTEAAAGHVERILQDVLCDRRTTTDSDPAIRPAA